MNLKPNPFLSTMMPQNLKKLTLILICLFISFLSFSQSNPDTVDDEGNEPKLKFWQNLKDAPLSFGLPLKNANTPLNIPTPDSTSEAVHPSIIDFYNEYGMTTWNGYRYWMAYTPYFLTNAIVENPVIAASNDGVTWVIPKGLKFPLIPAPEIGNNCDVDMVFNSDSDQLWVYYMYRGPVVIGNDTMISGLKLIKVNADMSSTDPMLVKPFKETDEATIVSPCIWRESATRWHM